MACHLEDDPLFFVLAGVARERRDEIGDAADLRVDPVFAAALVLVGLDHWRDESHPDNEWNARAESSRPCGRPPARNKERIKDVSNNARKLTARQQAFVAAYIVSLNATQAAREAGYSTKTASQIGERLLRNVEVAAAIEDAMKERAARNKIDADRVLQELARIAFFDIGKAFTSDGVLKPLDEMEEDTRRALAGLEVVSLTSDGEHVGTLKKVKIADKLGALTKLAQHLGMLDPKLTIKGSQSDPLTILIQQIQGKSLPVRKSVGGGDECDRDGS